MKFYHLDTSSFGQMLTDGLQVVYTTKISKRRLVLVSKHKIASSFILEFLGLHCTVLTSPLARKLYSFLNKLNFLMFDHALIGENIYFENLCKAQRYFRQNLLEHISTGSIIEKFPRKDRPIVVFAARTDYYAKSLGNLREHEITIRNCDLEWTKDVIKLLIDNGFFVVRIGTETNPNLSIESPFFFDYSLSNLRNEKNDFGICAMADFAVTNAGGIALMPSLLGIPGIVINSGLFTDIHPQEFLHHFLPKSVFNKHSGTPLNAGSLSKLKLSSMQQNINYDSIGLELRDVSPEDSLTAILEFYSEFVESKSSLNTNREMRSNFWPLPKEISDQFPRAFVLPESNSSIEIKLHRLWKNF